MDITSNYQTFLTRLLKIKTTNPDYFTDEATWQSEATLNVDGCVYKFVLNYDSTGTNVVSVRLPKYPDYVEVTTGSSATTAPVSGFVKSLIGGGTVLLPNANLNPKWDGSYALTSNGKYQHCDLFAQDGSGNVTVREIGNGSVYYVDAQADLSDLEIKSTKLKLYYYIQVATGQETENNIVNDIELNNPYVLFKSEYSETPLYNISWLKSDGEYQPKARYIKAYEALVVENNTDITVGTTVDLPSGTKYTKRGLSVKLSTASDITDYDFVINTTNESFKLPLKNHSADDGNANLILYYYVGETVQNANLIDAGRIGEELGNKTNAEQAAHASMPSNRYDELTLLASGSTYTAPADGWYVIALDDATTLNQPYIVLKNLSNNLYIMSGWASTSNIAGAFIPANKGDIIRYQYRGTFKIVRFIYCNGAPSA